MRKSKKTKSATQNKRSAPQNGYPISATDSSNKKNLPAWQRILLAILSGVVAIFKLIGSAFAALWRKTKVGGAILTALILVAAVVGFDSLVSGNRIYEGVHIGDVNVSGMTKQEAQQAVDSRYSDNLYATSAYIFANEEIAGSADIEHQMIEQEAIAEQLSFEAAQADKSLWVTNAQDLEATIPIADLTDQAFNVGRGWNLIERFSANSNGFDIPMRVDFGQHPLDLLINEIDGAIGKPMVNYNIEVKNGSVNVTDGNDGWLINRESFVKELGDALLANKDERATLVAKVQFTPIEIDQESARKTAEAVNAAIASGASFSFEGQTLDISRDELGDWISTSVEDRNGEKYLAPYIDELKAVGPILKSANKSAHIEDVAIKFERSGDSYLVAPQSEIYLPNTREAIEEVNARLFSAYNASGNLDVASPFGIEISLSMQKGPFNLQEALAYGVVQKLSEFTTTYTLANSTSNRNHNIHLAADKMNGSVIEADGGQWSFNEVVGETEEAEGYKDAGVIDNGEFTSGVGGGVCQVATTVFNAVYDAGLQIDERHNHSLYVASYPAGRDAAISYPFLDLLWTNDTPSDILLLTSYSDNSVTVTLYGVDTGRQVSTETGSWEEGTEYTTVYEVDDSLSEGMTRIKTVGADGSSIYVIRTVKDDEGNMIHQDRIDSVYDPMNEVILIGPNTVVTPKSESSKKTTSSASSTAGNA